jgi:hypothetical protein
MSRRAVPTIAAALAAAAFLAACGGGSSGPGVAGAGSAKTAAKSSPGATKRSALSYAKCMRSHGVKDFPDPNSKGQIELSAGPGSDLAPDSTVFKKADAACKSLMPASPQSPAQQRKDYAQAVKFASCIRAHGVQNFADPQPPGSGPVTGSSKGKPNASNGGASVHSNDNVNPDSPIFKKAEQACKSLMPGGSQLSRHIDNGSGS